MAMLRAQKTSLATLEEFAAGIPRVIDTETLTVERGHDPHAVENAPLRLYLTLDANVPLYSAWRARRPVRE